MTDARTGAGRNLIAQVRDIVVQHVADDPASLYVLAGHTMVSTKTIERALALEFWDAAFAIACLDALGLALTVATAPFVAAAATEVQA